MLVAAGAVIMAVVLLELVVTAAAVLGQELAAVLLDWLTQAVEQVEQRMPTLAVLAVQELLL
jgi:hypothetical protein